MKDDTGNLDKFDEALMTYELSDEALKLQPALTAGEQ